MCEKKNKVILAPAKPGNCPVCAAEHGIGEPHNRDSLHYQFRFFAQYSRWPTWADAIAHCALEVREAWTGGLIAENAWSEPESGEPIADHCDQDRVIDASKVFKVTETPLENNESI